MPVREIMRRAKVPLLVAAPVVLLVGALVLVFFRIERGLDQARTVEDKKGKILFAIRRLGGPEERVRGIDFEPVASASGFAAGAFFRGDFYLAGAAGLYVYRATGSSSVGVGGAELSRTYRVGPDLPAAPLGPLAVGTLRGETDAELMIATAGEGVLLFTPAAVPGDSATFRQLRPDAPEMRDVTSLLPLATGDLLLGTRRAGLLIYSGSALSSFRPETAGIPVTALADDGAGGFWMGTRDRGALHWSGGTMEKVDVASGLPDEQVECLLVRGANVFVGTPVGVAEIHDGRVARTLAAGSFAHTLAFTADGKSLAVGTLEEGVVEVSLGAGVGRGAIARAAGDSDAGETSGSVAALIAGDGDLYAVLRDGVRRRNAAGGWQTVVRAPEGTLSDGNISALAFAPDGRLWVGTFDHGIDVLRPEILQGARALNHLPGQGPDGSATRQSEIAGQQTEHIEDDAVFCVNRLLEDLRRNTMVAATANGLVLFDMQGRERQVLTRRDGLISNHVTDVAATRRGLALATPAGLTFVDADGTASVYGFQGLVNNHVYALAVQPDGNEVLAGTLGGLSLLSEESVRRNLTVANSALRHNWVTAIVAMPDGGWMVGTYGAGVMRLDREGHFTAMELPAGADAATHEIVVNPNALLATSDHVFAGTLGQGLWVYTRTTERWRQMTRGLPSENVTAMVERAGQIYVGTENGLVRIAEKSFEPGGSR